MLWTKCERYFHSHHGFLFPILGLMCSSIDVEARVTGMVDNPDNETMQQYLWSTMSHYLTIVEYCIMEHSNLSYLVST